MWPLARLLRKVPRIGLPLTPRLLIQDYSSLLPDADDATLKELAYLETFDMLSPIYDKPQTLKAFRRWFEEAGLREIEVRPSHQSRSTIAGRATRGQAEALART